MRSFHFYRLRYLRHGGLASPAAVALGVLMLTVVMAGRAETGGLIQPAPCVSETGTGGDCANGKALDFPRSVAVSRDGKHVYVASNASDAVALFFQD